jgi:2-keto-3-deoxy-L-rhamnonate aldolase RhmA
MIISYDVESIKYPEVGLGPSEKEIRMNSVEREMVEILSRGRENFGIVSVKAEFEAEGTRIEELLRLVDIARSAGLPVTVKIGGCEAIRDLLEAKQIGVRYVVAPMVESAYAASKYVAAKNIVFSLDEQKDTDFLFNMETITGYENRKALIAAIDIPNGVDGIVFGRVDFTGSMNWPRTSINLQETTDYALEIAKLCKEADKQFVVGGGVSIESVDALRQIHAIKMDRFETRKVVFNADAALASDIETGLVDAVHFELLWLENKRDYYSGIALEDAKRIEMLELRWEELKSWKITGRNK